MKVTKKRTSRLRDIPRPSMANVQAAVAFGGEHIFLTSKRKLVRDLQELGFSRYVSEEAVAMAFKLRLVKQVSGVTHA